jgi:hypothetical protein
MSAPPLRAWCVTNRGASGSYDGKTPNAETYPVTITHRLRIMMCVIVTFSKGLFLMTEPHFEILNLSI